MGNLFASFFDGHGLQVLVSDIDSKLNNKEVAAKGDIVIVAVSMGHAEKVIKEVTPYLKKEALFADITSVKQVPVKAMLKAKSEVLGLHPMFGPTNKIPGQPLIVCKTKKSGPLADWLINFFKNRGVNIIELTPKEHDELMTYAQGIIHFADIVFAHALYKLKKPVKNLLKLTSPASDIKVLMAARLIAQDPHLYGNIQILNPQNTKVLRQFLKSTQELFKIVKKKDLKKFTDYFNSSKKFLGNYANEAFKESTEIIDDVLAKRRQKKLKARKETPILKNSLAVLGPRGTYSDIAANKYGESIAKTYFKSIDEVTDAVAKGLVKEGIIPIENKLHGSIRESMDALFYKNIHIAAALDLKIQHCLITLAGSKKITKILSHSQALNQCANYLKKNFPKAEQVSVASTAKAVENLLISQDANMAVIAPKEAAKHHSLKIHDQNIANEKENITKFFLIKKGKAPLQKNKTGDSSQRATSIAFYFSSDSAGSLFTVFKDFADAKINMTKIESRPANKKFGEYIFYLDFAGGISDKKVQNTLKKIGTKVAKLKILGTY